jgi:hypothetical protein
MQKLLIGILTVTTAALAVLCAVQSKQLRAGREQVRATEQAKRVEKEAGEAQAARVKELERAQARLEKQVEDFTKLTANLRSNETRQAANVAALSQRVSTSAARKDSAAPGEKGNGAFGKGMGEMISKMMKDPSMREMMRDQQSAAVKMMYSGLFKELNLTPEEKDKMLGVLTDMQMKTIEASPMFGDKADSKEHPATSFADSKKQVEADIKTLLGDDRFKQYEEYQKNIGERMQLDQVKNSMAGNNIPLTDQQSSQIYQIMKEEKQVTPPVIPQDANQDPEKLKTLMTSENVDKQLQWMEDYNARVLARAAQVLTPEQLKQYQAHQEQQASMQKFGMKMAREMFSGDKGEKSEPAK